MDSLDYRYGLHRLITEQTLVSTLPHSQALGLGTRHPKPMSDVHGVDVQIVGEMSHSAEIDALSLDRIQTFLVSSYPSVCQLWCSTRLSMNP